MIIRTLVLFAAIIISSNSWSQQPTLPDIQVKTLAGEKVDIKQHAQNGKITVISFWATWCSPCKKELDAISYLYPDWQEQYGLEFIAISVDDTRGFPKIRPLVEQKGWEYIIYSDSNQDLMRALNFQTVPQTFVINRKGEIVYSHTGYKPGDEVELEEKLAELAGE